MKAWIWIVIILIISLIIVGIVMNKKAAAERARLSNLEQKTSTTNAASLLGAIGNLFKGLGQSEEEEWAALTDEEQEAAEDEAFEGGGKIFS